MIRSPTTVANEHEQAEGVVEKSKKHLQRSAYQYDERFREAQRWSQAPESCTTVERLLASAQTYRSQRHAISPIVAVPTVPGVLPLNSLGYCNGKEDHGEESEEAGTEPQDCFGNPSRIALMQAAFTLQ